MAIVPKSFSKRIAFYAARADAFEAHAAEIGASPELVAVMREQVEIARAAHTQQYAAHQAARTATQAMHLAVKALNNTGAAIIAQVRAKAVAKDDRRIYHLALLPPIADKSPLAPPGTPRDFSTSLDAIGNLTLRWKCKNPRGAQQTTYRVCRRIGFNGRKEYLGLVGKKQFTDQTIPAGATQLVYEVRAIRSTGEGLAGNFNVWFGSNRQAA
jgi:hypothetical protein